MKKKYSWTLKPWNLRLHNTFPGDEIQHELMSFYADKMKGIILELLGIAGIPRQNWNFEKIHILTEDTLWWSIFEKCIRTLGKNFAFDKTEKKENYRVLAPAVIKWRRNLMHTVNCHL